MKTTTEKTWITKKLKIRFLEGLFCLWKWRTNDPKLRDWISENNENKLKLQKIRGIIWNDANDTKVFNFKEMCDFFKTLNATKRNVLKVLAIFTTLLVFCNQSSLIWK